MSASHACSQSFSVRFGLASHVMSTGPKPQWTASVRPQAPSLHDKEQALSSLHRMLMFKQAFVPEQVTEQGQPSGHTIESAPPEQRFEPMHSN